MNKNRFFLISMIAVSALLFLLRMTGLVVHIAVSVAGLAIMIPITIKTLKEWKIPALEVIMRLAYLVAIITGGVLMKVHGVAALGRQGERTGDSRRGSFEGRQEPAPYR